MRSGRIPRAPEPLRPAPCALRPTIAAVNVWRDRLNRWLLPVARRTPLSPNAITLLALAINLVGAACLALGARRPSLFLAAIVLIAVGGLADALDGIVARARNQTSRYGDFLDHA